MKFIRIIASSVLAAAVILGISGCQKDKSTLSKAVMVSVSALYPDAAGSSQTITVYADADWYLVDSPDWISVVPDNGHCVVDVDITVAANYLDGAPDVPRSYTLVFKGGTIDSEASLVISQDGDKYRGVGDSTVDQIYNVDDDTAVSVPNVIVACVSTDGFIVSNKNSSTFIFVSSSETVNVGDEINVTGDKSTLNGLPIIKPDSITTVSTGNTVSLPTPVDITDQFDSYTSTSWDYISVSGSIKGSTTVMTVSGATYSVNMLNAVSEDMIGHMATLTGFFAGFVAPYIRLIVNEIDDLGSLYTSYFADDFEWIEPWCDVNGTIDPVGQQSLDTGTIIRCGDSKVTYNGVLLQTELESRGYTFDSAYTYNDPGMNPYYPVYICRNYLKFGMTNRYGAISLPKITQTVNATVHVSFDWTPMVNDQTYVLDKTQLRITVINGTETKTYLVPEADETGWEGLSSWKWFSADIELTGAKITEDTEIKIWNIADQWDSYNDAHNIYRWYIDNIEVYSNLE